MSASAHQLRRQADVERLQALAAASRGRVAVIEASPTGGSPIRVEIQCRTPTSTQYPARAAERVRMRINLPARYPFERPTVTIETPIFHPNIFTSGVVCQGDRWIASEGLDLLVRRMIRLVTYDPAHVNPGSAANRSAASWYLSQRSREPATFPTDRVVLDDSGSAEPDAATTRVGHDGDPASASARTGIAGQGDRVVRHCPHCRQAVRLPAGRQGTVACPTCHRDFDVAT